MFKIIPLQDRLFVEENEMGAVNNQQGSLELCRLRSAFSNFMANIKVKYYWAVI